MCVEIYHIRIERLVESDSESRGRGRKTGNHQTASGNRTASAADASARVAGGNHLHARRHERGAENARAARKRSISRQYTPRVAAREMNGAGVARDRVAKRVESGGREAERHCAVLAKLDGPTGHTWIGRQHGTDSKVRCGGGTDGDGIGSIR